MSNQTSPFQLSQPRAAVHEETIRDEENQPGQAWTFRMRRTLATTFHKHQSMLRVLEERYLTGTPDGTFPAIPFPAVGGQPVEISRDLFDQVALTWAMQEGARHVPETADLNSVHGDGTTWTCEEIIAIAAAAPHAWLQLMQATAKVNRQGNAPQGSETT